MTYVLSQLPKIYQKIEETSLDYGIVWTPSCPHPTKIDFKVGFDDTTHARIQEVHDRLSLTELKDYLAAVEGPSGFIIDGVEIIITQVPVKANGIVLDIKEGLGISKGDDTPLLIIFLRD